MKPVLVTQMKVEEMDTDLCVFESWNLLKCFLGDHLGEGIIILKLL
jgi:hypothetical protein